MNKFKRIISLALIGGTLACTAVSANAKMYRTSCTFVNSTGRTKFYSNAVNSDVTHRAVIGSRKYSPSVEQYVYSSWVARNRFAQVTKSTSHSYVNFYGETR